MQVRKGRDKNSVKLTFGERSNARILQKLKQLVTTRGIGRKITRKIYNRKKSPVRALFFVNGGYSKSYVRRVAREKGIELPQQYTLVESTPSEMAVTPRNVLDHLISFVGQFDKELDEWARKESDRYDVPKSALDFPRIRAIEIMYIWSKES